MIVAGTAVVKAADPQVVMTTMRKSVENGIIKNAKA